VSLHYRLLCKACSTVVLKRKPTPCQETSRRPVKKPYSLACQLILVKSAPSPCVLFVYRTTLPLWNENEYQTTHVRSHFQNTSLCIWCYFGVELPHRSEEKNYQMATCHSRRVRALISGPGSQSAHWSLSLITIYTVHTYAAVLEPADSPQFCEHIIWIDVFNVRLFTSAQCSP